MALAGLAGYWLTKDVAKTPLTQAQNELLNIEQDDFHASFVVAGRDIFYDGPTQPVYGKNGKIVCWRGTRVKNSYGVNTDTILYVNIVNDNLTMIFLPRDLFVGEGKKKLNAVYQTDGAKGLRSQVADTLGVPVDYYAVINLDIFKNLVDALGGVDVNVPERMYHRDCAADLTIDLQPGLQHLNGEQASYFARYRDLFRGDVDRIDNVKTLAYALLTRLKALNVRAVRSGPALVNTFFSDVETNTTPALLRKMLPRIGDLTIQTSGSLPTLEVKHGGTNGLEVDTDNVDAFLANVFGGTTRTFAEAPAVNLLITDRSGQAGLAEWVAARLVGLGVPQERLTTRTEPADPTPTRLVATTQTWADADYYASLFGVGKQQIDRFADTDVGLELVLGEDAARFAGVTLASE